MHFLDEPTAAIVGYTKDFQTTGFCDLKLETVCFSKTLLIKQTTGCHIHTIVLVNDHHLKLLQTVYWKLYFFSSLVIKSGNVSVQWSPCIKSHSCSLNWVITTSVTGPPEYEHFLHWHLMMETGPVLETLCLKVLKRMDTIQNISYAGSSNVHSCWHMSLRSHKAVCIQ
jgi:hypothetical protein